MKAGYKTTEFWLTLLAVVGSLALPVLTTSLGAGHIAVAIVGGVMAVLGAMGYTMVRGQVKRSDADLGAAAKAAMTAAAATAEALRKRNDNPTAIAVEMPKELQAPEL